MINKAFWGGKRVFLTGHTGFKGGWMALWLHSLGAEVTGYSLPPPSERNLFESARIAQKCDSHIGDIRDLEKMQKALVESKAEIVFHMAAQPLVRASYREPVQTYETNVMGTVHFLEAVRHTPSVRSCVIVTTDKCYENREWMWGYRETDRLGGRDPYSNSKACAELVTSAYVHSFLGERDGLGVASARAGNVIGGGDFAEDRLIPDLIRSRLANRDLEIRYPQATRPWQHVLVPLSGYLQLAQALFENPKKHSQAFNFGPPDSDCVPVGQVLRLIEREWGENLPIKIDKKPQPHEARFLKLDVSKAAGELSWHPVWSIRQTLKKTVEWYKAYLEGRDVEGLSFRQIQEFETDWALLAAAGHDAEI